MPRARSATTAATIAALIACAACTAGAAPAPTTSSPSATTSAGPGPSAPMAPTVRATINVGEGPCAVVQAFGRVWVTLLGASELVAIDPGTDAVVARYPLAGLQPCGITATATALWIGGGASTVVEIDPSSGAIKRRVAVPGPVWDLQAGASGVWVSLRERGQLVRIDPASATAGTPLDIRSGGTGRIGGVAVAPDGVYVADTDGRRIVHVAPSGAAVLANWPLPHRPAWLALEGATLWISSTADHVLAPLNTTTGVAGAPVPAGEQPQDPGAGAGVAYVADERGGVLTWATAAGDHGSVQLAGKGLWVTEVLPSGVWVLDFGGTTVVRLDPSPAATSAGTPSSASSTPAAPSGSAAADLDSLLQRLEAIHPQPFHGIPRADWVSRLEQVKAGLPARTPQQVLVDVMGLVAALSRSGRDGHQIVIPLGTDPMLPLQVFEFTDGLFITQARDSALVGARVLAVNGIPIDTVLSRLEPLVPRDSPASVPLFRPFFFLRADVLLGLGITTASDRVTLTIRGAGGRRSVELVPIPAAEFATWAGPLGVIHLPARAGLRYTDTSELLHVERIGASVYARLREVQRLSTEELARLETQLAQPGVTRVLFDLRQNPGGDNRTYAALLALLRTVQVPLWVLTDRATFSAASNLATELEALPTVRFAGEPMGGGLNFWDQVSFLRLEHLPIPVQVGISTEYFRRSTAQDPRLTIEPDLPAGYASADYFAGRDVLLDRLRAGPPG